MKFPRVKNVAALFDSEKFKVAFIFRARVQPKKVAFFAETYGSSPVTKLTVNSQLPKYFSLKTKKIQQFVLFRELEIKPINIFVSNTAEKEFWC